MTLKTIIKLELILGNIFGENKDKKEESQQIRPKFIGRLATTIITKDGL